MVVFLFLLKKYWRDEFSEKEKLITHPFISSLFFAIPPGGHTFTAMIKSMTGFGKSTILSGTKMIGIDIRALNSKQLDLNLRLPAAYKTKEGIIRSEIGKALERGKADVTISLKVNAENTSETINRDGFKERYASLKSLAEELGSNTDNLFNAVLSLPGILSESQEELSEEEWAVTHQALIDALKELDGFRIKEGNGLKKELILRVESIRSLLASILPFEESRITHVRNKLKAKFDELKPELALNENRFEEELIYYLEKLDISEEKQRLEAHCTYFFETMEEPIPSGRKLGFISQEMGREINTIGSKANQADMQKIVVLMKDELEKIKEQLNNIL